MKNILQVLSFDVAGKALLAFTGALLIRYMSQPEYVAYSVAYSLLMVFVQICSGCLNRIMVVGHETFSAEEDLSTFVWTQFLLVCAAIPVMVIMIGPRKELAWVCAASLLVCCCAEFSKSRFQRDLRFQRFSLVEFGRAVLTCAAVCALVIWHRQHLHAAHMQLINLVAVAAVVSMNRWPRLSRLTRETLSRIKTFATQLARGPYRHLFAYFCALAVFGQADLLLLRIVGREHDVATYASAYRYYNILLLALNAINTVLFPAVQRIRSMDDTSELKRTHRSAMTIFIPGVIVCMGLAHTVMPMVDQSKYPGAPAVFYVLAVSSILSLVFSPYLNYNMRFEDFEFLFRVLCVALVAGAVANVLLARSCGALGTAFSVLLSTAILNISGYLRSTRYRELPAVLVMS